MNQYADDVSQVVALKKGFLNDFCETIRIEMDNLSLWASNNKLSLNETKTRAIILEKKGHHPDLSLPFNVVSSLKLLGVHWRSDLT